MISLSVITQIVSCYLNGYWKQYVVNIQGEHKEYVKKKKIRYLYICLFLSMVVLFTMTVKFCSH